MVSSFATRSIQPIFGKGKKGQNVILCGWCPEQYIDRETTPVDNYPQPYLFKIFSIGYQDGKEFYILMDQEGNMVDSDSTGGAQCGHFYDAQEFIQAVSKEFIDEIARLNQTIAYRDVTLEFCKEILSKQGQRIVTMEQAKALGIVGNLYEEKIKGED